MSHTTKVTAPGWACAVLIHDGDWSGRIELRAWLSVREPVMEEPDFVANLARGVEVKVRSQHSRDYDLIYRAGQVVGAARLEAEITNVLESRES